MKIGLVCLPEKVGSVPGNAKINYIQEISKHLCERHEVYLFDWRKVKKSLIVEEAYAFSLESTKKICNFDLSNLDTIFVKQLGKIHKDPEGFLAFLEFLRSFRGKIVNSVEIIKKNLSKNYLFDLQEKGFPVIPTKLFDKGLSLESAMKISFEVEHDDIVIKPLHFGEQGQGVRKLSSFSNSEFEDYKSLHGDLILQPLMKGVFRDGEVSIIFLGNEFSHAVKKFSGSFKINESENSSYEHYYPSRNEINLCESLVKFFSNESGYTRVDMVIEGTISYISEVELVNPSFYIEDLVDLCPRFLPNLENLLVSWYPPLFQ